MTIGPWPLETYDNGIVADDANAGYVRSAEVNAHSYARDCPDVNSLNDCPHNIAKFSVAQSRR